MDSKFAMRMFPYIDSDKMNPIQYEKDKFRYYDGVIEAYNMTFSKYLVERNVPNI